MQAQPRRCLPSPQEGVVILVRLSFASMSDVLRVIGFDAASEACYAVQRSLR